MASQDRSATARWDRDVTLRWGRGPAGRWELPRSTASAAILTDLAAEHGLPTTDCLRGTGIIPGMLRDPDTEITSGQELRLVDNLVAALGEVPALGLEAGTRYHASTHGIWGFAIISSPTVRHALDVATRYFELSFSFSQVRKEEVGGGFRIVLDDSDVPQPVRGFLTERDIAAIGTLQRDLVATTLPAQEFRIALPEPPYLDRYVEITGNRPSFGAPVTTIAVDPGVLDLPLPQANPHTAELCERQCAELLRRRRERLGTAGRIRDLLLRRRGVADQSEIAADLHMSVRTLRRKLAAEGTSYRELAAETAGVLAEELLATGLPVEDVAHRLGYATASSLTHAFKQWRGTTPGAYARRTPRR